MRKSAVVIPLLALIAGVAGFMIRQMEWSTAFEATTGFAKRGDPVTMLLILVSAAVVVLAAAGSMLLSKRMRAANDYSRAFAPKSFLYLAASFAIGFVWLAADILYFLDVYGSYIETTKQIVFKSGFPVLDVIFAFLAAVSALSVMFLARGAYKRRDGAELLVFSIAPSVFFCFWLIILYKNNAANPVILSFGYQSLAIASAALTCYFSAGFVYKKTVTGRMLFSFIVTIYFCVLVLADSVSLPTKLLYGLTAAYAMLNAAVFLRNLKRKE